MLNDIRQLDYVIVLCDDLPRMRAFYHGLFDFPIKTERPSVVAMDAGSVTFCLRQRTRAYDGRSAGPASPGVQIAFCVPRGSVDSCYRQLLERGVTILDPPQDQAWGHRTVYFGD